MAQCLVALGSNLGDRRETLARAVQRLSEHPAVQTMKVSRWHETASVGGPAGQQAFLNGAALLETSLPAERLLDVLSETESHLGRSRGERWAARTLDLDLLLYDSLILDTPRFVVPHPRMSFRRFVLEPAAEVAAGMVHPGIGWTIAELVNHLDTAVDYVAITGPAGAGKTELSRRLVEHRGGVLLTLSSIENASAGQGWATEITFLQERSRQLDRARWPQETSRLYSDYWLGQSLAYARVRLDPEKLARFEHAWEEAARSTIRPKLLVVIAPASENVRLGSSVARTDEDRAWENIQAMVAQGGHGPVLNLTGVTLDDAFVEIAAAIDAMG